MSPGGAGTRTSCRVCRVNVHTGTRITQNERETRNPGVNEVHGDATKEDDVANFAKTAGEEALRTCRSER